ncbi:MAG: uroporphyrinogen decarboxylase [Bacteroidetes bacterium]|nr:uroporphyrinogen decarboxylase [Bacteroidota bacterium]
MILTDWVGYGASAVLLLSFVMQQMRLLRIFNIVGCLLFILYGFLIDQYPIIVTNTAIVGINIWFLVFKKEKK